ncbi:MAG: hypothetical protein KIT18_08825, partial [Burkholderiales bacterium]|nr:hypothetical protein [Burkholderiales bacterium]
SIGADYLLFAKKEIVGKKATYTLYSGHPTDKKLSSVDGKEVDSHEVLMDALEAGVAAYDVRRERYEAIKN